MYIYQNISNISYIYVYIYIYIYLCSIIIIVVVLIIVFPTNCIHCIQAFLVSCFIFSVNILFGTDTSTGEYFGIICAVLLIKTMVKSAQVVNSDLHIPHSDWIPGVSLFMDWDMVPSLWKIFHGWLTGIRVVVWNLHRDKSICWCRAHDKAANGFSLKRILNTTDIFVIAITRWFKQLLLRTWCYSSFNVLSLERPHKIDKFVLISSIMAATEVSGVSSWWPWFRPEALC